MHSTNEILTYFNWPNVDIAQSHNHSCLICNVWACCGGQRQTHTLGVGWDHQNCAFLCGPHVGPFWALVASFVSKVCFWGGTLGDSLYFATGSQEEYIYTYTSVIFVENMFSFVWRSSGIFTRG